MKKASELEIVDLGDPNKGTNAWATGTRFEENPILSYDRYL